MCLVHEQQPARAQGVSRDVRDGHVTRLSFPAGTLIAVGKGATEWFAFVEGGAGP